MIDVGLTRHQRAALDRELLDKLADHGEPATVAALFHGCEPTWAMDAADRLQVAGRVKELADGRLAVAGMTLTQGRDR